MHEHGMTIAQCLIEASKVLHQSYEQDERVKRVVRSVFAFLLYAADYWLDSFLHELETDQLGSPIIKEFLELSSDLATALSRHASPMPCAPSLPQSSPFGPLLDAANRHSPALLCMTRAAIASRVKTSLDPTDSQGLSQVQPI